MKKYLPFILIIVLVFGFKSYAQTILVPGGDFEKWTTFGTFEVSDNWPNSDLLWHINGLHTHTVKSDVKSHSGNFAARVGADTSNGKIWPAFLETKFAFNKRAGFLLFYHLDSLTNIDQGKVTVSFFKYNMVTKVNDSLGGANWFFPIRVIKNYSYSEIPITYISSDTTKKPDSASVKFFVATSATALKPGHVLVDDVSLIVGKAGIDEPEIANGLHIFPNPCSGLFNVELQTGSIQAIEIMDINGRILKSETIIQGGDIQIDISEKPDGLYFLKVYSGNIFTVSKIMLRH
jgi:hypothetical protein